MADLDVKDTKIVAIRNYLNKCPLLDEDARLNIDYLGDQTIEYGIYSNPVDPIIKRYVDGGSLRQYSFIFATKTYYSTELMQQLENSGFFELFQQWIDSNNENDILPDIDGAESVEILSQGYLMATDADSAVYQIQLRLIYRY